MYLQMFWRLLANLLFLEVQGFDNMCVHILLWVF